jgi:hypothetical protein
VPAGLGELAVGLLECFEQSGVLDGDDGLVRELREEGNVSIAERPDLEPLDAQRSDRVPVVE